ncbi:MAG: TAXI family TRAP transporter solute-binding subunit, partial [Desulfobacterales bacterium]|nr:TAXI family TRAP transporter solute-binding subunit [Desulfobacterales bacterium]
MKWTRLIALVIGIGCLASLSLTPVRAAELIPFYTPPAGGGAYILGAGMISVTNKYISGTTLVHEATTGTMDIVRRMMQREGTKRPSFGIFGNVDAWKAYKGNNEYAGKPFESIRAIVYCLGTDQYFVVPANSSIKSFVDAKGKRIGVGGAGSTGANTALFMLEQHGITKNDFKPYYFVYNEVVQGLQDGSLDAGFLVGGFPIPAYTELSTTRNVRIVPVDEKVAEKIVKEYPYYYRSVVKAKSYKGLEQDTPIMGFSTSVWTYASVDTDLVYNFLKN